MIQATELRIGNIIASSGNPKNKETWVIGKVKSISSMSSEFEQVEVETKEEFTWFFKDNYFGIPLSEEILIKAGFELEDGEYLIAFIEHPFKFQINSSLKREGFILGTYHGGGTYFKYLHQLQNLYFVLTGQELIIKL